VAVGTLTSPNHIYKWTGVTLQPGANDILVWGKRGGQGTWDETIYTDEVTWYAPGAGDTSSFALLGSLPGGMPVSSGNGASYGLVFQDRGNGFSYGASIDVGLPAAPRIARLEDDLHRVAADPGGLDGVFRADVEGAFALTVLQRSPGWGE
jgi:hypothetical protein